MKKSPYARVPGETDEEYAAKLLTLKARRRRYYLNRREKEMQRNKQYNKENPDVIKSAKLRFEDRRKDRIAVYNSNHYKKNKEKKLKYNLDRYHNKIKNDAVAMLSHNLRSRIRLAVRAKGTRKSNRTFELVGCRPDELRDHLASKFTPGMSLQNYGLWEVDHVIPVSKFDLRCPLAQRMAFHFSNLQPLWKVDNLKKGAKWDPSDRAANLDRDDGKAMRRDAVVQASS